MKKKIIIISVCVTVALLIAAALVANIGFRMPYQDAETTMDPGNLKLVCEEDGTLILSWPESATAEQYHVQVQKAGAVLFDTYITDSLQCKLPQLPLSDMLTVRISSIGTYQYLFDDTVRLREGTTPLEVTGVIAPPAVENVVRTVDPENDTMYLQFSQHPNSTATLFWYDDNQVRQPLMTTRNGEFAVAFGDGKDLPELVYGKDLTFGYTCEKSIGGMDMYWSSAERVSVCREDFLGTKLNLETTDLGNNRFSLQWEETKGDHQLLQLWNTATGTWETVKTYGHQDALTYDTGYLPKYNTYTYRVVGVGGQTLPDSEFSTQAEETELTTGATALFATIWPIQKLEVYDQAEGGTVIGSVPEGKAFSVAEICGNMFRIRYEGEKLGYIDSNYCMVNLPEFIDDRCVYHISNSFESRYMVHNYGIPEVTDEVTTGYEKVQLADGSYLVPLLYPTAQKLDRAASAAIDQGYKLMIYDSYRPQKATLELYEIATALMEEPLPPEDYYEMPGENAQLPETPETDGADPDTEGDGSQAEPVTYSMLMTDNGRYALNYFLARGGSRHNMGIALDLTLYDLTAGEEVEMQSKIHDLSWYSEVGQNNHFANTLGTIMKGAGFGGLSSEWWHFQDNDALNDLKLTNYMYNGISAECWMADENGWRYRRADGNYETNTTKVLDGITYRFDDQGYASVTEGEI